MKACAQLTEHGWINIAEDEFQCCGNGKHKAYALFVSDHDYAGGGGQFHVGIDYDTPFAGPDYVQWDDDTYWPSAEDAASYAAINMESDLDTDVIERKNIASMMVDLLGDAAITEAV